MATDNPPKKKKSPISPPYEVEDTLNAWKKMNKQKPKKEGDGKGEFEEKK